MDALSQRERTRANGHASVCVCVSVVLCEMMRQRTGDVNTGLSINKTTLNTGDD